MEKFDQARNNNSIRFNKVKSLRRLVNKRQVDSLTLKVLEFEQKRIATTADLEFLTLINEKDKNILIKTELESRQIKENLSLIEKRIMMLSREHKNKFSELTKATRMARQAHKMKQIRQKKRKMKESLSLEQKKTLKSIRRKAFNSREDTRNRMIEVRNKLKSQKRKKNKIQNSQFEKMMNRRIKKEKSALNERRMKNLSIKLKKEKQSLRMNRVERRRKVLRNKILWNSKHQNKKKCSFLKDKLLRKMKIVQEIEDHISHINQKTQKYHFMYRNLVERRSNSLNTEQTPKDRFSLVLGITGDNEVKYRIFSGKNRSFNKIKEKSALILDQDHLILSNSKLKSNLDYIKSTTGGGSMREMNTNLKLKNFSRKFMRKDDKIDNEFVLTNDYRCEKQIPTIATDADWMKKNESFDKTL